jgi:hypothetical protein
LTVASQAAPANCQIGDARLTKVHQKARVEWRGTRQKFSNHWRWLATAERAFDAACGYLAEERRVRALLMLSFLAGAAYWLWLCWPLGPTLI